MRVIALYGPKDLREEEWPKPEPGDDEVRIKIKSVCICGSDTTQYSTGGIGNSKTPVPFVLGHEVAGLIDAVGSGVENLFEGTPVAVEPDMPCMQCELCLTGRQNICPDVKFLGASPTHGALAEFIIVPAQNALPVKAPVTFAEIACIEPLAIGIYAAQKMKISSGDTVAVFGSGGIGLSCMIAAKKSGARIIAVTDKVQSRLDIAEKYGSENTININEENPVEKILGLTNGRGVDVTIEAAGELTTLQDAISSAAIGGRVAIIGIPHEQEWSFPAAIARRRELLIQNIRRSNHTTEIAIDWIERREIKLAGFISHNLPWEKAEEGFNKAAACEEGTLRISLEPEEIEEPFYP